MLLVAFSSCCAGVEEVLPFIAFDFSISVFVCEVEAQGEAVLWGVGSLGAVEEVEVLGEFIGGDGFVAVLVVILDELIVGWKRRDEGGFAGLVPCGGDDVVAGEDGCAGGGGGGVGVPYFFSGVDVEGLDGLDGVDDQFVAEDDGGCGGGHGCGEAFARVVFPDLFACGFIEGDEEVVDVIGAVKDEFVADDDG